MVKTIMKQSDQEKIEKQIEVINEASSAIQAILDDDTPPPDPPPIGDYPAYGYGSGAIVELPKIYTVTTLQDTGQTGSLRYGLETVTGRTEIRFAIAGWIDLRNRLTLARPDVYINGTAAPGNGIGLKGHNFDLRGGAKNIIIRSIRSYPGRNTRANANVARGLTLSLAPGDDDEISDILIDHSQFAWGSDETLTLWNERAVKGKRDKFIKDVTIQHCLIHEPLDQTDHTDGAHGYAVMLGQFSKRVTFAYNLIAHARNRNPYIRTEVIEAINNVIYNPGHKITIGRNGDTTVRVALNYIGNIQINGRNKQSSRMVKVNDNDRSPHALYLGGNYGQGSSFGTPSDQWDLTAYGWGNSKGPADKKYRKPAPYQASPNPPPELPADQAMINYVLENAGVIDPGTDAARQRIINDVHNGTGRWISNESEVGGYPELK